jgi:hypothetical protein
MLVTGGLGGRSALVTQGYGTGVEPMAIEVISALRQNIYATDEPRPLVGTKAERLDETAFDIQGYHYDRKRFIDENEIATTNPGFIGNIIDGASDGTIVEYWKSGIGAGSDCDVEDIIAHLNSTELKWSPRVLQGEYFSHLTGFYLFGDGHVGHPLITGFAASFDVETDYVELEYIPDSDSPIVAGIYRRESDYSVFPWRVADLVGSLTGIVTEPGTRESTALSDGTPDYTKVDDFLRWEIVYNKSTNRIHFNKNMACLFGDFDSVSDCELLGTSDGAGGQLMYFRYLPVDPGTRGSTRVEQHRIFVGSTLWSVADDNDLSLHGPADQVYQIDYDLGIVEFGGNEVDASLYLAESVTALVDEITLSGDIDMLPAKGVLQIESEKIAYLGKTSTQIVQVIRGYAGTAAAAHAQDTELTYVAPGAIPANGAEVRAAYYTTPRIEYAADKQQDLVVADDVNVRPVTVPEGNGIVYITRVPLALETLLLEIDKPLISGGLYGPLNIGADFALLTATAYSPVSEPVPRLPIEIEQTSAPPFVGLLNGSPFDYESISNYSGQINTSYVIGNDFSAIFLKTEDVVQASSQTLVSLTGDYTDIELDEVFIYVITKDDPIQGTVGVLANYDPGSLSTSGLLPGSSQKLDTTTMKDFPTITVGDIYPDNVFNGGMLTVYTIAGLALDAMIKYWRSGTVYLEESLSVADGDIDFLVLNKPDWIAWNASTLNGKKRVLYEYNSNAVNPVSGALGAYFPIQPSSSTYDGTSTTFVFDKILPLPDAADIENNVGGYMLTVPRVVSFRARATDPLTGRTVLSNTIDLKIFVPDYLNGVYLADSGRIPYGLRTRTDSLDAASGLDGAVFVTINPVAGSSGAVSNPFATMIHLISV